MNFSTVSSSLLSIVTKIRESGIVGTTVYDPATSYETSIGNVRVNSSLLSNSQKFPILSYNRSVLRASEIYGSRRHQTIKKDLLNNVAETSTTLIGAYDFKFMFISQSMSEIEQFEVAYLTGSKISDILNITADLGSLGSMDYSVQWNLALDDLSINIDSTYYKILSGSATVTGPFTTFYGIQAPLITEIETLIFELEREGLMLDFTVKG